MDVLDAAELASYYRGEAESAKKEAEHCRQRERLLWAALIELKETYGNLQDCVSFTSHQIASGYEVDTDAIRSTIDYTSSCNDRVDSRIEAVLALDKE